MRPNSPGLSSENAEKSRILASALFPGEEWVLKETGIWVAKSRIRYAPKERTKLAGEIEQIQVLIGRGSAAYLLPESKRNEEPGKRHPDMVLDGEILEIKTVTGAIKTLGLEFKRGYKQGKALLERLAKPEFPVLQGHSVFIRLFSDLTVEAVKAKIAGELKNRLDKGTFICLFEQSGELYSWSYGELRSIIGKR
jgi:hypothetical protein